LLKNLKIDKIFKMINRPIATGIPSNTKYITDITQEKTLIINYQQSKLE
jgi:hypothetical protein